MASVERAPLSREEKKEGKYFPFLSLDFALSQLFERGSCSVSPTDRTLTFLLKVLFLS